MAASSYDAALARLLAHEGGYTNHPADPGGPTNFGITIADYRRYVKPNASAADVRAMKLEDAKAIYRAKYWRVQRCDDLPAGVDYAVFDYGVNSGIGRSGKVLRRVLKLADDTSAMTDAVIAAARAADARTLVTAICDERLRFLQSLKTWPVFGRRVADVKSTALTMAAKAPKLMSQPSPSTGRGIVRCQRARSMLPPVQLSRRERRRRSRRTRPEQARSFSSPFSSSSLSALTALGCSGGGSNPNNRRL